MTAGCDPAHALDRRNGFERTGRFGDDVATDFNVFLAKALAQTRAADGFLPGDVGAG